MKWAVAILVFVSTATAFSGMNRSPHAESNLYGRVRAPDVAREVRRTFDEILARLNRLKRKHPQLAAIERATITESQLAYEHGRVRCQSKAQPCSFTKNACRLTINIMHVAKREEADLHAAESQLFELADGTYLDVYYGVLAETTATGRRFERAASSIISTSLENLRERLASQTGASRL